MCQQSWSIADAQVGMGSNLEEVCRGFMGILTAVVWDVEGWGYATGAMQSSWRRE